MLVRDSMTTTIFTYLGRYCHLPQASFPVFDTSTSKNPRCSRTYPSKDLYQNSAHIRRHLSLKEGDDGETKSDFTVTVQRNAYMPTFARDAIGGDQHVAVVAAARHFSIRALAFMSAAAILHLAQILKQENSVIHRDSRLDSTS